MTLTTHIYLALRLRMNGSTPLLSQAFIVRRQSTSHFRRPNEYYGSKTQSCIADYIQACHCRRIWPTFVHLRFSQPISHLQITLPSPSWSSKWIYSNALRIKIQHPLCTPT